MTILELVFLGLGLGMDAFAVSICKGLAMKKSSLKSGIIVGIYFGIFQAVMPIIGYVFSKSFSTLFQNIDHWIAFFLLTILGLNMIKETIKQDRGLNLSEGTTFQDMVGVSIATSIDALAVGITFAFFKISIIKPVIIIGGLTFLLAFFGVFIGNRFGAKFKDKAQILGGVILILIGIKILIEHLT